MTQLQIREKKKYQQTSGLRQVSSEQGNPPCSIYSILRHLLILSPFQNVVNHCYPNQFTSLLHNLELEVL